MRIKTASGGSLPTTSTQIPVQNTATGGPIQTPFMSKKKHAGKMTRSLTGQARIRANINKIKKLRKLTKPIIAKAPFEREVRNMLAVHHDHHLPGNNNGSDHGLRLGPKAVSTLMYHAEEYLHDVVKDAIRVASANGSSAPRESHLKAALIVRGDYAPEISTVTSNLPNKTVRAKASTKGQKTAKQPKPKKQKSPARSLQKSPPKKKSSPMIKKSVKK